MYGLVWVCMLMYGLIWVSMIIYGLVWVHIVIYGLIWSCMVFMGLFCLVWSWPVLYGPPLSCIALLDLVCPWIVLLIWSYTVKYCVIFCGFVRSDDVLYVLLWTCLYFYSHVCSFKFFTVMYGSILSCVVLYESCIVMYGPVWSSCLVLPSPIRYYVIMHALLGEVS